jgi:hypothetical protein
MGPRSKSKFLALVALAAALCLIAGCGQEEEQIKVYRVVKAPVEPAPAQSPPAPAPMSFPPGHPPIATSATAGTPSPEDPQTVAASTTSGLVPTPPHWETQPLSQMRQASFLVHGETGTVADISLVTLGASSGNVLENVNRWLGQLGQPPITAAQLSKMVQHLPSKLGNVTVVDIEGKPEKGDASKDGRIIAAIAPAESGTSFFKMRGNAALAGAEKENFLKWVSSIRK